MRQLLIEGLSQAEVDCTLPKVRVIRNLKEFLLNELNKELPLHSGYRLIAHPPIQEYNLHKLSNTTTTTTSSSSSSSNSNNGRSYHHNIEKINNLMDEMTIDNAENNEKIGTSDSKIGYVHSVNSLRFSEYTDYLLSKQPTISINTDMIINNNENGKFSDIITTNSTASNSSECASSATPSTTPKSMLLAVGPEGGWLSHEVSLFQQQHFQLVHLGNRILRTDIAVRLHYYYDDVM